MKRHFHPLAWPMIALLLLLMACSPASLISTVEPTPSSTAVPTEEATVSPTVPPATPEASAPLQKGTPGGQLITYLNSEGIGKIAVRITFPQQPRYPDGAGVVVSISTFLTRHDDFEEMVDVGGLGLIRIAYLWPGVSSASSDARSDGVDDYGGPQSIQALRDVIRFATGLLPDVNGRTLGDLSPFPVLTDNVGLYAFSHPGIAAVNVLALYGEQLPVAYFVGRENPTVDTITAMELGHWGEHGEPQVNPLYHYPESYSPTAIHLDYSHLRWDAEMTYPQQRRFVGYPYFDLNDDGRYDEGDFMLSYKVPTIEDKRLYSAALTQALLDNGALTMETWPDDLIPPQEAAEAWAFRSTPSRYPLLREKTPDLKVMLVFDVHDHVQPLQDKPNVHQAYDGFHTTAGLWVRLNPDLAYVEALRLPGLEGYREHPANHEPGDWMEINEWAHPHTRAAGIAVSQAAVAEMADRTHEGRWEDDLDARLFPLMVESASATPEPTEASVSAPLLVFYVIHAQIGESYTPYTDASLQQLDPTRAQMSAAIIEGIAQVAETHGMPITWEFPQALAKALCAAPDDLLGTLQAAGDEIGAYAHSDTLAAVEQTLTDCGYPPETVGGLLFDAVRADDPLAFLAQELDAAARLGFRYATGNLSPNDDPARNPFAALCHDTFGEGNEMWAQSGNLFYPWSPDYAHGQICADHPGGDLLLVDHTHPDWLVGADGRNVLILGADNFTTLRGQVEGALAYRAAHPDGRTAVWGFVSHLSEYTPRNDATAPPAPQALEALDDFLAYLEALQQAGQVRLVTVNRIPFP